MERAKTMERKQITLRIPEEVYEALKDVLEPYRQNEEKVKINLTVSEKKYKALSQIAESLEQPISTTILQIVDDYLTKF